MSRVALPRCGARTTFSRPSSALGHLRLALVDVETGTGESAGRSASASAASSTTGPRAVLISTAVGFINAEAARVDEMTRLGGERDVERDDVGLAEQRVEVGVSAREDRRGAEGLHEPRRLAADPTAPDDQHRLALETLAEHELERELPRLLPPHEAVALGHAPQERQHQRQRDLGRGARQDVGRIGDDHASAAGSVEVDVVHADGVVRDDPQLRPGCLEVGVVDGHREHRHDPVCTVGRRNELEVGARAPARPRGAPGR